MSKTTTKCELCNVEVSKEGYTQHILGKKHQKILEYAKKRKEAVEKGIFVKGFPQTTWSEHLHAFFSKFGIIDKFVFNKHFAIIQFLERQSADVCLSERLYFNGCLLHIKQREMRENEGPVYDVPKVVLDYKHIAATLSSCGDNSFESQLAVLLDIIHLRDCSSYETVCSRLQATFSTVFPQCKVYPFGSTVTGLAFKGSDLDVFMDIGTKSVPERSCIPESPVQKVNTAKRILHKNSYYFGNIFAIPKAKTPIVKFVHKATNISCDLSFKNAFGVNNSFLIKHYLSLDPRLRPLLLIIKYWAAKNDLTGHGKITNYALVMICLFYLQQTEIPVIPTVADLQRTCEVIVTIDGWDCSIDTNTSSFHVPKNTMSVPELLCGFFTFFSLFDYGLKVMCPLIGSAIPKTMFQKPEELPDAMRVYKEKIVVPGSSVFRVDCDLCIQDPFELSHNLTLATNSKALDNFKNYCAAAAKVCSEILAAAVPGAPSLLGTILDDSTKPKPVLIWSNKKAFITIPLGKYVTHTLSDDTDSSQQDSCIILEDELRRRWYKTVLEFLLEIFEKVMKFDVRTNDAEHSNKVLKLEGQTDVCEKVSLTEKHSPDVKIIHCSGRFKVWEGRKGAQKKLELPENTMPLVKEGAISDYLLTKTPQASTSSAITNFVCIFRPEQNPTRVILEICDEKSCKEDFGRVITFLQGRLPLWIEKCMKQQHDEQAVKKQV